MRTKLGLNQDKNKLVKHTSVTIERAEILLTYNSTRNRKIKTSSIFNNVQNVILRNNTLQSNLLAIKID